jgi:hypothetical protein
MANSVELFTTRSGKQVPIPEIKLPSTVMTSVMRLQEDYALRGQKLSLTGVVLEMLAVGKDTIERRWNQAAKNKELRNSGKAVREYIRTQSILGKPLDPSEIARLAGMQVSEPSAVESEEETILDGDELTDEQLEAATNPSGVA